jgi:hypothetical protein
MNADHSVVAFLPPLNERASHYALSPVLKSAGQYLRGSPSPSIDIARTV